jgi:hypothetical protein
MSPIASIAIAVLGACPAGQSVNADTKGNCCYAGQVWSTTQSRCVGVPTECPAGQSPSGETCAVACPPGMTSSADTAGQCCWPGQAWASGRSRCVGVPSCPGGMVAAGETCVTAAAPLRPPPFPAPGPSLTPGGYGDPGRAAVESKLADLRYKRSRVSYAGGIITLSIGVPVFILGSVLAGFGFREPAALVLGWSGVVVGGALITTGSILLPIAAVRAGVLNRQIRAAELELAQYRALYVPQLAPEAVGGLALMLSSPVFTF